MSDCDINQTQYAQIALFSVCYAQAKLWQSWGVPYRIAGCSFGGVLAYEIAKQLEVAGEKVETVILYDIGNPALLEHNGAIERLKLFWDDQEQRSTSKKLFSLTKRIGRAIKDRTTVEVEHRVSKLARVQAAQKSICLLYTSPSPRDRG